MSLVEVALPDRRGIALYFGALLLGVGLVDPLGIAYLPILYFLKDQLGLRPPSVAVFEAVLLLPAYCAFLFGFLRDRWRPPLGDRGYLLLAAPIVLAGYLFLAARPLSYGYLLGLGLMIMVACQFMSTASQSLLAVVAGRHDLSGGLSSLAELVEVAPRIVGFLLGGWLVTRFDPQATFLVAGAVAGLIAVLALLRPAAVFAPLAAEVRVAEGGWTALRRLFRHGPLWPSLAILLLWNFAPGWETPLFYFLSDDLRIPGAAIGVCKAAQLTGIGVTAVLYGAFSHRFRLRQLLVWAVAINILPPFLFLWIRDAPAAIAVSAVVGLSCGLGNVAVFDLLLRACPKGLEGAATMLGVTALTLGESVADLLGAQLFERGGFLTCIIFDAVATLCILPVLSLARGSAPSNRATL